MSRKEKCASSCVRLGGFLLFPCRKHQLPHNITPAINHVKSLSSTHLRVKRNTCNKPEIKPRAQTHTSVSPANSHAPRLLLRLFREKENSVKIDKERDRNIRAKIQIDNRQVDIEVGVYKTQTQVFIFAYLSMHLSLYIYVHKYTNTYTHTHT